MSNRVSPFPLLWLFALLLVGCGWNPEVKAVPISKPWSEMGLPVQQNAVIWTSEEKLFKAVHRDDKKVVMEAYVEAFKRQGWTLGKFESDPNGGRIDAELEKAGEKISLEVYDFDNTGVIIEKV